MKPLWTAGLLSLALLVSGTSPTRAGDVHAGGGFGYTLQSSAHFSLNLVPYYIPACPNPYGSRAYAPYFQYGWPHSIPVYPGVEPGYGFAPTPWILPPSPSGWVSNCPQGTGPVYAPGR